MANGELVQVPDNVRALLDAGRSIGSMVLGDHDGNPCVVIPERYKLQEIPLAPAKVKREVTFSEADSFAEYVNKFRTPGVLIFAAITPAGFKMVAHLDYHDKPVLEGSLLSGHGWSSHTAVFTSQHTPEWKTWMGRNGEANAMKQPDFALFLEDQPPGLFRSPDNAQILELVSTLEGKSNVRFNQGFRTQNGQTKIDYEEDVELRGGGTGTEKAVLEIPQILICAMHVFEGQEAQNPYEVRARLRYRIASRQLLFWYETIQPHVIVRDAVKGILEQVRERVKAPVLIGG